MSRITHPTIPKTINICPKCNKRIKITQDKKVWTKMK